MARVSNSASIARLIARELRSGNRLKEPLPMTTPDPTAPASGDLEAVAAFLKERDENVAPGEADDAERLESARCILAALRPATATAAGVGDLQHTLVEFANALEGATRWERAELLRTTHVRIAASHDALIARVRSFTPTHRHKVRGSDYELLEADAELQAQTRPREGDRLAIYRGADGKVWARPASEFNDGRFALLSDLDARDGG